MQHVPCPRCGTLLAPEHAAKLGLEAEQRPARAPEADLRRGEVRAPDLAFRRDSDGRVLVEVVQPPASGEPLKRA